MIVGNNSAGVGRRVALWDLLEVYGTLRINETTAGTAASPNAGSLLLNHGDSGGASSIVFQSAVNRGSDYAFIEYRDNNPDLQLKNPDINLTEAGLLTIGNQNDGRDHIALMASGNVGVGTTTPEAKLHVKGNTKISGDATVSGKLDLNGNLLVSGSLLLDNINVKNMLINLDQGYESIIFWNSTDSERTKMYKPGAVGGRTFTQQVSFRAGKFASAPQVVVSLAGLDTDKGFNVRTTINAESISASGFSIKVATWGDSLVYAVTVSWIAFGV
jgi:hypothetical protein